MRPALVVILVAAACGDDGGSQPDAGLAPTANATREILDTQLAFDVTALSGTATIVFAASATPGATLEVGDLVIDSVSVPHAVADKLMTLALPASASELSVDVAFHYSHHTAFDGVSPKGYTLLWPYHCGNLFPCHSDPSDGTTFSSLAVTGVPDGATAVYPTTVSEAPSYQIAFSVDMYTEVPLGTTTAGTQIVVWHRPANAAPAMTGTTNLVAAFDWLEQTIGPYRFGNKAGTVDANWGAGGLGGMEHHPFWHVGSGALADQETNVHEAAHGWFGDGIRIQCWEDFVLSEGTVTYLAGRALDVVAPSVGTSVWNSYASELTRISGSAPVWPQSCGAIDIIEDDLFSNAPYIRGAFLYRGIAQKLGDPALLDQAIAAFYAEHAGKAATMQQMLDKIQAVTGYDPTACAQTWLRSTTKPTPGPCP
jgi:aminopeptidase N